MNNRGEFTLIKIVIIITIFCLLLAIARGQQQVVTERIIKPIHFNKSINNKIK